MNAVSVYLALSFAAFSTIAGASGQHRFLANDNAEPVCEYRDFKDVLTCVKDNKCVDKPKDQIADCVQGQCIMQITQVLKAKPSCRSVFVCLQKKMGDADVDQKALESCAPKLCSWRHLGPFRRCAHVSGKCLRKPANSYISCMAANCLHTLAALMNEQPQCQVKTSCLEKKINALGSTNLGVGIFYGALYSCADHRVEFDQDVEIAYHISDDIFDAPDEFLDDADDVGNSINDDDGEFDPELDEEDEEDYAEEDAEEEDDVEEDAADDEENAEEDEENAEEDDVEEDEVEEDDEEDDDEDVEGVEENDEDDEEGDAEENSEEDDAEEDEVEDDDEEEGDDEEDAEEEDAVEEDAADDEENAEEDDVEEDEVEEDDEEDDGEDVEDAEENDEDDDEGVDEEDEVEDDDEEDDDEDVEDAEEGDEEDAADDDEDDDEDDEEDDDEGDDDEPMALSTSDEAGEEPLVLDNNETVSATSSQQ